MKLESAHQFVPMGTSSKEFKQKQKQIKENRRQGGISAGPQSHILEGVSLDDAQKLHVTRPALCPVHESSLTQAIAPSRTRA